MGKGVAIPYIIALVMGLIVLAVMVYLIYRFSMGERWQAENCKARFIEWCIMCKNIGWSDENKLVLPQNLVSECKDIISRYLGFNIECTSQDWCNNYCNTTKTKLDCCTVGVKNEKC